MANNKLSRTKTKEMLTQLAKTLSGDSKTAVIRAVELLEYDGKEMRKFRKDKEWLLNLHRASNDTIKDLRNELRKATGCGW